MARMNHVAGSQCLLELDDILAGISVPYFLMQGTALGAYRDGGFTETEKDIDLGILYENFKYDKILEQLCRHGFDVEVFQMPFTQPKTIVGFKEYDGHVVHVDLVGWAKWKDKRFTSCPVRDYIEEPYCIVHDAVILEPPYGRTVELWGRYFLLPANIEHYLFCEYGPYWRTPRDDHMSRTRVYNYLKREEIPNDYLSTSCRLA